MPQFISTAVHGYIFHRQNARPLYLMLQLRPLNAASQRICLWSVLEGLIGGEETSAMAAMRLLTEQTGLTARQIWGMHYLDMQFDPMTDSINIIPAFAIEVVDAHVALTDNYLGHRWVTHDQAQDMLKHRGIRNGLTRAHEDIVSIHVRNDVPVIPQGTR